MRELNEKKTLIAALRNARDYTLAVYAHLDEAALQFPYASTVNPPLWELAHLAWFQEHWCLRWRDGAARERPFIDGADAMLNSAIIAHAARWELSHLTWPMVRSYLERVLAATIDSIERTASDDRYFPRLALYHEDMHAEACRMSLQVLALPEPPAMHRAVMPRGQPVLRQEIGFPGGVFLQGSQHGEDFVFDNEMHAHEVTVAPFALAACTVTESEYQQFVDAGGYLDARLWSKEGWRWRSARRLEWPCHWRRDGALWRARRFDRWEPIEPALPMMLISAYEAEAYATYAGARLPSESEWEFAARFALPLDQDRRPWGGDLRSDAEENLDLRFGATVPVDALAASDSAAGLRQMFGNVWEWTSTTFAPYPGFEAGPYREYSQPWFGNHRVLRGGSFATRSRLVHSRWRNFYTPERTDVFAGIRLARSLTA